MIEQRPEVQVAEPRAGPDQFGSAWPGDSEDHEEHRRGAHLGSSPARLAHRRQQLTGYIAGRSRQVRLRLDRGSGAGHQRDIDVPVAGPVVDDSGAYGLVMGVAGRGDDSRRLHAARGIDEDRAAAIAVAPRELVMDVLPP
jgi:hypothetical protein